MRDRLGRHPAPASYRRRPLHLVGLSNAFISQKPRAAHRRRSREQITRKEMRRRRNRSRNAQRERAFRSRADLGRLRDMSAKEHLRVSNPPAKPLMIWDGECHFCRRWIERWRVITAGEVDYATYQEIADRFPEIPREQFQRSVVYIDERRSLYRGRGGLPLVTMSIFAQMVGVELRSRSRFRGNIGVWFTRSSRVIARSLQQLRDCSGAKTCDRRLISGRENGSCARSASFI